MTALPGLTENLDRLISSPSVSSANTHIDMSNGEVIDYLAQCFEDLGFSSEIIPSESLSGLRKANLVASLGSGPGGLVLAGHTDTVPLDEALWQVDPFRVTEKDGRLYGLGSSDMKGFFPLIMEAVRELQNESGELSMKHPLIVLATADEESSMNGARAIASSGRFSDRSITRHAVIGEPTGLKPIRAHKGTMMESIRLLGRSGHSSDPSLGRNALEAMHEVISELLRFRADMQKKYRNPLFRIEIPTLNLGCIHGGDNPNRICGQCELEFDLRLMPGMEIEDMRDIIASRVKPVSDRFGVTLELAPLFPGIPAFVTEDNSELLCSAEKLTGHQGETVAFGTEAPFLQEMGMDTIILGPGDIDQAHQPDEYLALDRLRPCIDLLKQLIRQYCL